MIQKTEYGKQIELLTTKCFTDKFKQNQINLDVLLDKLNLKVDRVDVYDDGGIMSIAVDLNDHNKTVLSEVITDFNSYNELVDLEFHSSKKENQTDLCSLLDYSQNSLRKEIIFEWDSKTFNYR